MTFYLFKLGQPCAIFLQCEKTTSDILLFKFQFENITRLFRNNVFNIFMSSCVPVGAPLIGIVCSNKEIVCIFRYSNQQVVSFHFFP